MKLSEQDRKMQELLREFDKELFKYTGQIPWLVSGIFSLIALALGAIPVDECNFSTLIIMVYITVMLVVFILFPYEACNDFGTNKKKTDNVYNKLKYIPLGRKNYIHVRMGYLFRYLWKLCAIELVIHIIISLASRSFNIVDYLYVVGFMFVIPLALGFVKLIFTNK
jgi:hypothetical protein